MATSSKKEAAAAHLATDAKLAKAEKMAAASKKAAAAKKVAAAKKAIAERKAKKDAADNDIPSKITVTKETSNDNAISSDSSSSSESLEDDEGGKLEGEIGGIGDEASIEAPENVVRKNNKKSKDKTKVGKDKVRKQRKRKSTEDISTVETTKKSKADGSVVTERKVTTKVEESFIVRDKKRLDVYVRKVNNLDKQKVVGEDHYLKTINSLMNKYVAVSTELKLVKSTQVQSMLIDDRKVLHTEMLIFLGQVLAEYSLKFEIMFPTQSCVKSQKKAMKTAQIHEKTQFAQRIKTQFLKGKWSKEFVNEFQDPTNFKKLWW
eukprot:scaffold120587_cov30-Attheya_sp.AAC.1